MSNYSDMKATKESRSDKLKEIAKSSSSSSSGGKRGGRSSGSSKTTRVVKKKAKREIKKAFSKLGLAWIIVGACLLIGLLGGFFGTKIICKNDVYQMVAYESGLYDITIGQNEDIKTYTELGVKCIAFGKEYTKDYTVEYYWRDDLTKDEVKVDSVDPKKEGIYYAVYSVPTFKYKTVKLIRNIIVIGGDQE